MPSAVRFATTRWSLVQAAQRVDESAARSALGQLCELYWSPIYSFICRRGADPDRAQDLTQEFFARLLEREGLTSADAAKGRFRSYLLAACQNFLANQRDFETAQKRGGGITPLSLSFLNADSRSGLEPADGDTPEQAFERRWALAMLEQTLAGLRAEYSQGGKEALFEKLKGSLTGDSHAYSVVAVDLGLSEGAVKVAAHRLRQRYRERLREAIAETVASPDEIDDEIRALFAALAQ
jgi:DNA-directed RNA polymerase specialized sigma24 family protein